MAPHLRTAGGPVAYAVSGPADAGTRDLVLLHGWCCDRSTMAPLREHLAQRHRVLAVDLRGHGASLEWDDDGSAGVGAGRRDDPAQLLPSALRAVRVEDYAEDVLAAAQDAGLRRPVVVGHSLGGLVALAAARRREHPPAHHPAGTVLLEPAPVLSARASGFWWRAAEEVDRDLDGHWRRRFATGLFPEHGALGAASARDRVVDLMASTPAPVAAGAARALARFDGRAALAAVHGPVLVVEAGGGEDLGAHLPASAPLTQGRTVGAGHFLQLEVPDQVLAMLARWLEVSGLADAPARLS